MHAQSEFDAVHSRDGLSRGVQNQLTQAEADALVTLPDNNTSADRVLLSSLVALVIAAGASSPSLAD